MARGQASVIVCVCACVRVWVLGFADVVSFSAAAAASGHRRRWRCGLFRRLTDVAYALLNLYVCVRQVASVCVCVCLVYVYACADSNLRINMGA